MTSVDYSLPSSHHGLSPYPEIAGPGVSLRPQLQADMRAMAPSPHDTDTYKEVTAGFFVAAWMAVLVSVLDHLFGFDPKDDPFRDGGDGHNPYRWVPNPVDVMLKDMLDRPRDFLVAKLLRCIQSFIGKRNWKAAFARATLSLPPAVGNQQAFQNSC